MGGVMIKWSYQVETVEILDCIGRHDILEDKLSAWGNKGWELVCITEKEKPRSRNQCWIYTCTFKFRRGGISPDKIAAAKDCLRRAGIIDMPEAVPA